MPTTLVLANRGVRGRKQSQRHTAMEEVEAAEIFSTFGQHFDDGVTDCGARLGFQ